MQVPAEEPATDPTQNNARRLGQLLQLPQPDSVDGVSAGGGSPGRLCPTVEKSAGLLSSHQHCRGRGGHSFSSMTSAHPSVHQLPGQEQPPGSPAGSGCPAGLGSHREGQQRDFSRVLQPAVPGA